MNKNESPSSDLSQKEDAGFCDNLVSEIEKLAVENHQEDILDDFSRRIGSLISWNEAIPPHLSTLKKYIRTLIRKILFTAIRNCYNYDFPYIADQASKLTQAETTAAPQGEQWQLLREGTAATPYRRKTNEMVTSHFKSKTMKYSCYEPQNYRNYNYAAYFVEHCIPRLIEKKPEFSLVFLSDSQEKITEEYVRIAKLHGSKNPANTRVTAPKILNTPPCCHGISGCIKDTTIKKTFRNYFNNVALYPSEQDGYSTFVQCSSPYLTTEKLCSVSVRGCNEKDIVAWIADMVNAFLESQFNVLTDAHPYCFQDSQGRWQYRFFLMRADGK